MKTGEPPPISEKSVRALTAYADGLFPASAIVVVVARKWTDGSGNLKLGCMGNMNTDGEHLALLEVAAAEVREKMKKKP